MLTLETKLDGKVTISDLQLDVRPETPAVFQGEREDEMDKVVDFSSEKGMKRAAELMRKFFGKGS